MPPRVRKSPNQNAQSGKKASGVVVVPLRTTRSATTVSARKTTPKATNDDAKTETTTAATSTTTIKRGRPPGGGRQPKQTKPKVSKLTKHTTRSTACRQKTTQQRTTKAAKSPRKPALKATPCVEKDKASAAENENEPRDALARAQWALQKELGGVLPCREKEFDEISRHIEQALTAGTGSCLYISGVPGVGKTATFFSVLRDLRAKSESKELPEFDFAEINGMRVTDPAVAYTILWESVAKERLPPSRALSKLTKWYGDQSEATWTNLKATPVKGGKRNARGRPSYNVAPRRKRMKIDDSKKAPAPSPKKMVLVLLDELDYLVRGTSGVLGTAGRAQATVSGATGPASAALTQAQGLQRQEVLYNLLEWCVGGQRQLIVVAISNTMDLPERELSRRVASRMGAARLDFAPYTETQLLQILQARLTESNAQSEKSKSNENQVFNTNALGFAARKISTLSGDARRMISVCSRAIDEKRAEIEISSQNPKTQVKQKQSNSNSAKPALINLQDVNSCFDSSESPVVKYLRNATSYVRLLAAVIMRATDAAYNQNETASPPLSLAALESDYAVACNSADIRILLRNEFYMLVDNLELLGLVHTGANASVVDRVPVRSRAGCINSVRLGFSAHELKSVLISDAVIKRAARLA